MQKQSGITIMELMSVIGILGILAGLAVPSLIGWMSNQRMGSAARDVLSVIERTRLTAVRANASASITFQLGGDRCTASVNGAPLEGESLPADISFSGVTFVGQTLQFDGQGMPSEGGSVTLTNGNGVVRNVVVSFGGNASIQ